ncbi:DUF389 domain-containing protein [Streptomyces sp. NPDC006879]|uniref:DUF389 domain-containing protein n=1 Tax=Streptomyces sp. NPDC006879 TaxID=3364767 RepID=UPI0036CDF935
MLHLRMITPQDRTEEVLALVDRTVGTTHVAVFAGVGRDPAGDMVMCDVTREAGDGLLNALRALGLDRDGSIAVENIDLTLSQRAVAAERESPGEPADAVLWAQLSEATQEESTFSFTYLAFISLATMIAACGVALDNAILIVGAMAVGPEFGPLAGVCTNLVQRRARLAGHCLATLLGGFAVAIAVTTLFSLLMTLLGQFDVAILENPRPNTGFIWRPDSFSFVIALLAGVAGMLSLTSAKSGALVGVAISVTTVPAAANAAVALSFAEFAQMWGSLEQLLLNLAGIMLSGTVTLVGQKLLWRTQRGRMTRLPGAPMGGKPGS